MIFLLRSLLVLLPLRGTATYRIRIGTRPSSLAVLQGEAVAKVLCGADPLVETTAIQISARGDMQSGGTQDVPLALKSVDFTGSLDLALSKGDIDLAVQSLKDVPPTHRWQGANTFSTLCPLPREDPADVLVGTFGSLASIPRSTRIGTSSIRRQAQILSICNDVELVNVRGNLDSRLRSLDNGTVDCLILAEAGLKRLGIATSYTRLAPEEMLPGVCQGIVGVVCCSSDDKLQELLRLASDHDATIEAAAERAFLDSLDRSSPWEGRPPLAGLMERIGGDSGDWSFRGLLARPDGKRVLRATGSLPPSCGVHEATALENQVGLQLLAKAGLDFFS